MSAALRLRRASAVTPKPSRWVWGVAGKPRSGRVEKGAITLVAGKPGTGKSTLVLELVADLTKGTLPGVHHFDPKGAIVCATENSYEHTIVPRLLAAGADVDRIAFVELVEFGEGIYTPESLDALTQAAKIMEAGLIVLDPLMSRLGRVDTHNDGETRTESPWV